MHYKAAGLHEVVAKGRRCRPQHGPRDPVWLERVEAELRIVRRDLGGDGNGPDADDRFIAGQTLLQ